MFRKIKYIVKYIASNGVKQFILNARAVRDKHGGFLPFIVFDMLYCSVRYGAGPFEYKLFDYKKLGRVQRGGMISQMRNQKFVAKLNTPAARKLFDNKSDFNRAFEPFLRREWVDAETVSFDEFANKVGNWKVLVCKPPDGMCGKGIEFIEVESSQDLRSIYEYIKEQGITTVEQLVRQHPDIAEINPLSVNTLRMVTLTVSGGVHLVACYMRFGIGSQVDNLNSGGFAVSVNPKSGIIDSSGGNNAGRMYERHPHTGAELRGRQLPFFLETRKMIAQTAMVEPGAGYVGWDAAITPDGPLLIEGNCFPGFDLYHLVSHQEQGAGMYQRFKAVIAGKTNEFLIAPN